MAIATFGMRQKAQWLGFLVGLLLMPIAATLGVISAGAGHGNYFLAKVLFPFTMLSTFVLGSITAPFILVALAQFPIYGWVVGQSARHKTWTSSLAIALAHALAAMFNVIVRNPNF